MKKRLTKSREVNCDLFTASNQYNKIGTNKIGTHLVLIRWITTSSRRPYAKF